MATKKHRASKRGTPTKKMARKVGLVLPGNSLGPSNTDSVERASLGNVKAGDSVAGVMSSGRVARLIVKNTGISWLSAGGSTWSKINGLSIGGGPRGEYIGVTPWRPDHHPYIEDAHIAHTTANLISLLLQKLPPKKAAKWKGTLQEILAGAMVDEC